jgi:hypothetical protein
MARIDFLGIQIFWLLLLGTLGDAISKVVFLKYLRHNIYFFSCMRILNGILFDSTCISPLLPFEFRSIDEGFFVPFLLRMCMRFLVIFIFRFLIFLAAIMHNECMCPWAFDCAHVDELGFLLCKGFGKVLKRRHILGGSRGEYDRMECGYEYREFNNNLGENGENNLFLLLRFINLASFKLRQ